MKNIVWILLIFIVPIALYAWLSKDELAPLPAIAAGDEVIKFGSPLCMECQDLENVIDKVFPKYSDKILLKKLDISKHDKNCQALIKEYNVQLVPTTVFKNQDGRVLRRVEGTMKPDVFESYLVELINE